MIILQYIGKWSIVEILGKQQSLKRLEQGQAQMNIQLIVTKRSWNRPLTEYDMQNIET